MIHHQASDLLSATALAMFIGSLLWLAGAL